MGKKQKRNCEEKKMGENSQAKRASPTGKESKHAPTDVRDMPTGSQNAKGGRNRSARVS
jgi:hypothetical protein